MSITPEEMKALTGLAHEVKAILDPDGMADVLGTHSLDELSMEQSAAVACFAVRCVKLLTGPDRLEWAKVVRRSVDLYGLGVNSEKQFNTGDNERGCKSVQQAESIEREINALANLLAAGMEGSE